MEIVRFLGIKGDRLMDYGVMSDGLWVMGNPLTFNWILSAFNWKM